MVFGRIELLARSSGQWRRVRCSPHMQPARVSDSAGARHSFEWDAASYNSSAIKALYGQARQMLQALQQSAYRWRFEAALSYERDALGRITEDETVQLDS